MESRNSKIRAVPIAFFESRTEWKRGSTVGPSGKPEAVFPSNRMDARWVILGMDDSDPERDWPKPVYLIPRKKRKIV